MAYETPITIAKTIERIKKRHYVLPAIQREFVWKPEQIQTLFDSLMRDYPIGTFLFWKVDRGSIKDFQFYEFLKKYHKKNHRHNPKADLADDEDITAVLDGQQRLTSLYIALAGSYSYKLPRMRYDNPSAYPERKLYLNLLQPSEELETEYDFCFLTQEEVSNADDTSHWFDCHRILSLKDKNEMYEYLDENGLSDTSLHGREKVKFARNTLNRFHDVIHKDGIISSYQEEGEELDKVLQIFIRINSGGTVLNYSDILLSIATAQWKEKDAREVIHAFVDDINKIGTGFNFDKDLVLKSCLVLSDLPNIKFKVDNFTKENMEIIESKWEGISSSLRVAIELISKFGYNRESLIATNAVIPIAYFIYKSECGDHILRKGHWEESRKSIKEWLARVLLKGTFGGTPDSIYPNMRDLINQNSGQFPLREIIAYYKGRQKSISFSKDEIDNLLELQYQKPRTYCALTLLYPALDYHFRYDKDHIHPKSRFDEGSMKELGFSDEEIENFNARMNGIANLQLLEATSDMEKNDKPLKEWLESKYPDEDERKRYLMQNHIHPEQSLEFKDFIDFVDNRHEKIKKKFMSVLGVTDEEMEGE